VPRAYDIFMACEGMEGGKIKINEKRKFNKI
jgi:hypothetical protein